MPVSPVLPNPSFSQPLFPEATRSISSMDNWNTSTPERKFPSLIGLAMKAAGAPSDGS